MQDKVCPVLTIGWISNFNNLTGRAIYDHPKDVKNLKCLKEDCALWIPQHLDVSGYCGLINKKEA